MRRVEQRITRLLFDLLARILNAERSGGFRKDRPYVRDQDQTCRFLAQKDASRSRSALNGHISAW